MSERTWDDIVDRLAEITKRRSAAGIHVKILGEPAEGDPESLTVRDDEGGADLTFVMAAYADVPWLVRLVGQLIERIDKEVTEAERLRANQCAQDGGAS